VSMARRGVLSLRILAEDVIGLLYRSEERTRVGTMIPRPAIRKALVARPWSTRMVLAWLLRRGDLVHAAAGYGLSEQGRQRAKTLVRSHRLWEQYLVTAVGVDESRLHPTAEQLEHFTDPSLRSELDKEMAHPSVDPHGAPIPSE
jgi:manganese/zinc/iron transport system permease protein